MDEFKSFLRMVGSPCIMGTLELREVRTMSNSINPGKQLTVKDVMQSKVFTISPNHTVFQASVVMTSKDIGSLLVVNDDGTLVGIITDRDLITRCIAIGKDINRTKIFECMTSNPTRTVASATCLDAAKTMAEFGTRRLPVVEHDKLVGVVSISDIAKHTSFCPNEKPYDGCVLVDLAREIQTSSHCEHTCGSKTCA